MPGNDLLFHVLRQSTIGAERLDCRVRNGIGYNTFAIITRQTAYTLLKIISKAEIIFINYYYLIIFRLQAKKAKFRISGILSQLLNILPVGAMGQR